MGSILHKHTWLLQKYKHLSFYQIIFILYIRAMETDELAPKYGTAIDIENKGFFPSPSFKI